MFLILSFVYIFVLHHREHGVPQSFIFLCIKENLKNSVRLCILCGGLKIYSSRKASAGSTFTALRTGINVPIKAMTSKAK